MKRQKLLSESAIAEACVCVCVCALYLGFEWPKVIKIYLWNSLIAAQHSND